MGLDKIDQQLRKGVSTTGSTETITKKNSRIGNTQFNTLV